MRIGKPCFCISISSPSPVATLLRAITLFHATPLDNRILPVLRFTVQNCTFIEGQVVNCTTTLWNISPPPTGATVARVIPRLRQEGLSVTKRINPLPKNIINGKGKDASNDVQRLGQDAVVEMEILLLDRTWKLRVRVRIR